MSANAEKGRVQLKAYKAAQRWVKKNPLPKKAHRIITSMIESKKVYGIRGALIEAGFGDLVETLGQKFGLFQAKGRGITGPLAPTMKGLVYTNQIRCANCHRPLDRLNALTCSIECQKAVRYAEASERTKAWRARQTPEEKARHQENIEAANLAKYGVRNYSQTEEGRARIKATNANRTEEERKAIRRKAAATLSAKHGMKVANPMDLKSIRKKQRDGVRAAYAERNAEIQNKKEQTMLKRYGVTHQIHLEENRHKVFRGKHITVQGKEFFCQGYEDHVLRYLDARGWKLSVSTKGIKYRDLEGRERTYYPDIKAVKAGRRLLIEVKSVYTFNWTKANQPTKFLAGTKYAQDHRAKYLVCVVEPTKNQMRVLVDPKRKSDLKLKVGRNIQL